MKPFLIIYNCRYGTKLTLNLNADSVPILNQNKKKLLQKAPSNGAIWENLVSTKASKGTSFRAREAFFLCK